jgi:hypothetical protein
MLRSALHFLLQGFNSFMGNGPFKAVEDNFLFFLLWSRTNHWLTHSVGFHPVRHQKKEE